MAKKNNGKDFLFSDDCGFINGDDEGGESYRYSDGSGYYHGADGSEGYIYSDLTFILLGTVTNGRLGSGYRKYSIF